MERAIKVKFLESVAKKYDKAERGERSTLLDQIVNKLGVHRKSAIRALRAYLKPATNGKKKVGKKASPRKSVKRAKR